MEILSKEDYKTLKKALVVVGQLSDGCTTKVIKEKELTSLEVMYLGKLQEACDQSERVLQKVINVAGIYLNDPVAKED